MWVTNPAVPAVTEINLPRPSFACVAEKLESMLATQDLKAGQALPKLDILAAQQGVARATVTRALRLLSSRGLAHRRGRSWRAGPADERPPEGAAPRRPVIMLLMNRVGAWRSLLGSMRTFGFCVAFNEEAQRYGIQVVPVFTSQEFAPHGARHVGFEAACAVADAAGERFLGTLVPLRPRQIERFEGWFDLLLELPGKVVCLDPYDMPIPGRPAGRRFIRCHFSEETGVAAALEHLAQRGHRCVGCPVTETDPEGWQTHRATMVQQIAQTLGLSVTRIDIEEHTDALGDSLVRAGTLMDRIMALRRNITALIPLSDIHAMHLLNLLASKGVKVPSDMSLVTFDNGAWSQSAGLSSVDFGFNYLGYAAFHLLFGVVPVPVTRSADVAARAHVVDRGTVSVQ